MASVFAVVLTFNRKELLRRCLDCIFTQSRACDRVVVIDNCSSDGTSQMLRDEWAGRVEVHTLSRNVGASGGFNVAIRVAYQAGADFVWLMDDDVLPDKDALAKLIEADQYLADKSVERAFVLSTAWTEDGRVTNVPKVDTRPSDRGYENWPLFLERRLVPVTRATFVSILLPRSTIAAYGLPLAPMFIWGEDSEYTLRITGKCPGFLVSESKVVHLRQVSGTVNILTETNDTRLKYHRHYIRNHLYIARVYSTKFDYVRYAIRQLQMLFTLLGKRDLKRARIVVTGILESLWFRPPIETADTAPEQLGVAIKSDRAAAAVLPRGLESLRRSAGPST
ncbi:glycosyltransferase family 2 protein [Dongia deserti]|uniref:glycosyltransferase family 2 protein n=1 Tax=Dongia deserti TaxID=2268030 RepID=UPI000E649A7E|nr:glycosyltransferase family 2 protein [Dongia deserti]